MNLTIELSETEATETKNLIILSFNESSQNKNKKKKENKFDHLNYPKKSIIIIKSQQPKRLVSSGKKNPEKNNRCSFILLLELINRDSK